MPRTALVATIGVSSAIVRRTASVASTTTFTSSGMTPPPKTAMSSACFSFNRVQTRGSRVLWAPERIDRPTTSTSSCTAVSCAPLKTIVAASLVPVTVTLRTCVSVPSADVTVIVSSSVSPAGSACTAGWSWSRL